MEHRNLIVTMCFILISAITTALLLSLLILQIYLIGKNVTTNEYLKNMYNDKDNPNPFDEGCVENFRLFFMKKVYPKQINLSYLQKRILVQNQSKHSSEMEIGNKCEIFANFSNKYEKEEKKIEENLLHQ